MPILEKKITVMQEHLLLHYMSGHAQVQLGSTSEHTNKLHSAGEK